MGYRNKTYVIFDADQDMWAYGFMLGWNTHDHMDFDFHDAHDLNTITDRANEDTVKRKLRLRFANTKQAIVLIGEKTKNLYRFVRWELDTALELGIPIIAVNLNGKRSIDEERCPPILKEKDAVHVAFKMNIIKHAMDNFAQNLAIQAGKGTNWHYPESVYTSLGL
jgi:MTH538 TIR-like domain (DUF1863)